MEGVDTRTKRLHRNCFQMQPNQSIRIIKRFKFKETFFGRIRALNTTLDFGWISSGEEGTHLNDVFWSLVLVVDRRITITTTIIIATILLLLLFLLSKISKPKTSKSSGPSDMLAC